VDIGDLYFWLFAGLSLLAGIRVITSKEAIYSALWLLTVFISLSALYLHLKAPMIAIFQVTIYAGAILVLIIFVLTLLTRPDEKMESVQHNVSFRGLGALSGIIATGLALVFISGIKDIVKKTPVSTDLGSTASFAKYLLNNYLIHFEIASVLLLAALICAIYIAKKDKKAA